MAKRLRPAGKLSPSSCSLTPKKAAALEAFIEYGTVTAATRVVGVVRQTWYDWRNNDPEFAARADEAADAVGDDLEQEAIKRAREGSDTLLIFLLKGHRPAKYRERYEHSGPNGGPIETRQTQVWEIGGRRIEF